MAKNKNEFLSSMIDNFCNTFSLANSESEADVVYDMANLREFFNIPFSEKHDDMRDIVAALDKIGFNMQMSYDDQPAMFLNYIHKRVTYQEPSMDDEFNNYIEELPEKPILAQFPKSLKTL